MPSNKSQFARLERVLQPEYLLKNNPGLQKLARQMRLAVSRAGKAGADSMRNTILYSPTRSPSVWHDRKNIWRQENREPISGVNNQIGSRIETGNMYNSVSRKYGKIVSGKDKRYKQDIVGGFGWPADEMGNIKDAPSSPMSKSRMPDTPNWRSDPRYFAMQEYGFDGTRGMKSQETASLAARKKLEEELMKLKRKK
jgi:hypothetical protein